jgi:hypothetical protein
MGIGTNTYSAWKCYGIHILAFLVTFLLILIFNAYYVDLSLRELTAKLREEFLQNPMENAFVVLITILLIEMGLILLGLILAPWGARDEPVRQSLGAGIKRVWLASAIAIAPVLAVGTLDVTMHRWAVAIMRETVGNPPPNPYVMPEWQNFPRSDEEQQMLDAAVAKWTDYHVERQRRIPWILNHTEPVIMLATMLGIVLLLWRILAVLGAARSTRSIECPPMCEWCGYNLMTLAAESRCPECGRAVAESLGENVRPGTLWERRKTTGHPSPWIATFGRVLTSPTLFGRSMRITVPQTGYRSFMTYNLLAIGMMACGLFMAIPMTAANSASDVFFWLLVLVMPGAVLLAIIANLLQILLVAAFVGVLESRISRRNLFPASMQAAAYQSAFLIIWCTAFCANMLLLYLSDRFNWDRSFRAATDIDPDFIKVGVTMVGNLGFFLAYIVLVTITVRSTRYANK